VLIVDDDPVQAGVYAGLLARRGFTSQVTGDSRDALQAFARRVPEGVLVDLGLPRMHAVELIRTVRDLPQGRDVRIFVLANAFLELEALAAWEAGADQVVGKANYAPDQVLEFLVAELGTPPTESVPAERADPALSEFLSRASIYVRNCREGLERARSAGQTAVPLEDFATAMRRLQAAQAFGLPAIPQLASVAEWLARALLAWPSSLGPSSLRTLAQALDAIDRRIAEPRAPVRDVAQCRALGVDDDATCRILLQQAFRKIRVECDLAPDGPSALTAASARRHDIVVTDVMMPGMDGFELLTRIHALPGRENVPAIYVTAIDGFDRAFERDHRGACDAIVKPYLIMELATKVVVHLVEPPAA
jgi:DNA-binding response OmpR family regulator